MKRARDLLASVFAVLAALFACSAQAQTVGVQLPVAQTRVEQYIGGPVTLWHMNNGAPFPGTSCLNFTFTGPAAEVSRVVALVLAAKTTNRPLFAFFNSANCAPVSVSLD